MKISSKMNKLAAVVLSLALTFGLVACSDDEDEKNVAITGITVTSVTGVTTLAINKTLTLSAAKTPSNATSGITWESSAPSIATVAGANTTATVSGVANGSVTITAKGNDSVAAVGSITLTVSGTDVSESGVDFTNYASSTYSLKVTNNSAKRLVAFKGTPSTDTLIGGIPASASNHGLKKVDSLFSASGDFVLFLVTEENYNANKDNLSALETKAFGKMYAYYNTNAVSNFVYQISSIMGGDGTITVDNGTGYYVELRRNGIYGETIGYAGPNAIGTTFKVDYGNYYVFPVFRKYDSRLHEIVTVYPKNSEGKSYVKIVGLTSSSPSARFQTADFVNSVTFTQGYAYIRIINSSSEGFEFFDGNNSTATSVEEESTIINSGSSFLYALKMDLKSSDSATQVYEYESSKQTNQLYVGNALISSVPLSSELYTYEAGKIYNYVVTGEDAYHLTVQTPNVSELTEN
ncbi:MAG: Ig domain-containing protein [Treponema sp.]|nr:Ig domain-containing protein [Treponema sp.]